VSRILLLLTDVEQWQEDATNWRMSCTFASFVWNTARWSNLSGSRVGDIVIGVRGADCRDVNWIDLP